MHRPGTSGSRGFGILMKKKKKRVDFVRFVMVCQRCGKQKVLIENRAVSKTTSPTSYKLGRKCPTASIPHFPKINLIATSFSLLKFALNTLPYVLILLCEH